jgi:hypothetical protein
MRRRHGESFHSKESECIQIDNRNFSKVCEALTLCTGPMVDNRVFYESLASACFATGVGRKENTAKSKEARV